MNERSEFSIGRASSDDLDAVALVWHQSGLSMDGPAPDVPPPGTLRRRIDAELTSGWDLYVARKHGRVVGMLAVNPSSSALDQIFVAPGEQRKGIGLRLLEVAKQVMPGGFMLRMAASNERARRFYEKGGLKLVSEGVHPLTAIPVHFYGWNVDEEKPSRK